MSKPDLPVVTLFERARKLHWFNLKHGIDENTRPHTQYLTTRYLKLWREFMDAHDAAKDTPWGNYMSMMCLLTIADPVIGLSNYHELLWFRATEENTSRTQSADPETMRRFTDDYVKFALILMNTGKDYKEHLMMFRLQTEPIQW